MDLLKKHWHSSSLATKLFIGLLIVHIALTFILPVNQVTKAAYQLDNTQYYALLFTVRLPVIAVWIMVFYSYRWLTRYAGRIADTPEGPYFTNIARGVGFMAWGFIIPAIIVSILNAFGSTHEHFRSTALIIGGYLYVVVPLVAFSFISAGAHALSRHAKVQIANKHIRIMMFALASFSVVFCLLVATRLDGTTLANANNPHNLPNGLVWTTIVIPYLYAAYLGMFAVLELGLLARRTPGVIYKQGLQLLTAGLVLMILMLVSLQYFRSVIPRTGNLTLGPTLVATYAIYSLAGAGSVLLTTGAKRLKKIEDA